VTDDGAVKGNKPKHPCKHCGHFEWVEKPDHWECANCGMRMMRSDPLGRARYVIRTREGQELGTLTTNRLTWGLGDTFFADDGSHMRLVEFDRDDEGGSVLIVEPLPLPESWNP